MANGHTILDRRVDFLYFTEAQGSLLTSLIRDEIKGTEMYYQTGFGASKSEAKGKPLVIISGFTESNTNEIKLRLEKVLKGQNIDPTTVEIKVTKQLEPSYKNSAG